MSDRNISIHLKENNLVDQKIVGYIDIVRGDSSSASAVKDILLMQCMKEDCQLPNSQLAEQTALINDVQRRDDSSSDDHDSTNNDENQYGEDDDDSNRNWIGHILAWLYYRIGVKYDDEQD